MRERDRGAGRCNTLCALWSGLVRSCIYTSVCVCVCVCVCLCVYGERECERGIGLLVIALPHLHRGHDLSGRVCIYEYLCVCKESQTIKIYGRY